MPKQVLFNTTNDFMILANGEWGGQIHVKISRDFTVGLTCRDNVV